MAKLVKFSLSDSHLHLFATFLLAIPSCRLSLPFFFPPQFIAILFCLLFFFLLIPLHFSSFRSLFLTLYIFSLLLIFSFLLPTLSNLLLSPPYCLIFFLLPTLSPLLFSSFYFSFFFFRIPSHPFILLSLLSTYRHFPSLYLLPSPLY